ncbi:hypothetical protein LTR16_003988, partial [Cryomyces antarcticus]
DFADFIRSTGPDKEQNIALPLLANRSMTSLHSVQGVRPSMTGGASSRSNQNQNQNQNQDFVGQSPNRRHSTGKASVSSLADTRRKPQDIPPVPSLKNRTNMQPRSPTGGGSGSSGLADFIRNGPPGPQPNGPQPNGPQPNGPQPNGPQPNSERRNSRGAAPHRSTMDSADLNGLVNDRPGDRAPNTNLGAAERAYAGPGSRDSVQSARASAGSRASAGLPNGNSNARLVAQPAHAAPVQRLEPPEPRMPVRKRSRVKDPYAIDTEDEDDDLLTAMPKPKARHEENLIDFLRNVPPPTVNQPPALPNSTTGGRTILNGTLPAQRGPKGPPSLGPGPGPGRPASASTTSLSLNGTTTMRRASLTSSSAGASSVPSARPAHITNQVSSGTSVPKAGSSSSGSTGNPGAAMTPRSAGSKDVKLARLDAFHPNDLADFLRSSGPEAVNRVNPAYASGALHAAYDDDDDERSPHAGGGAPAPPPTVGRGPREARKAKKFWRKRTYLDMP